MVRGASFQAEDAAEAEAEAEAVQRDSLHHHHIPFSFSLVWSSHVTLGGNPRLFPSLALECKLPEGRPRALCPQ